MNSSNLTQGTQYLLKSGNGLQTFTVQQLITGLDSKLYIQLSDGTWWAAADFDTNYTIIYSFPASS
ncbi:MAG: hypothetical protein ACLQQ4_09520 [Bacteroidia bacterium]